MRLATASNTGVQAGGKYHHEHRSDSVRDALYLKAGVVEAVVARDFSSWGSRDRRWWRDERGRDRAITASRPEPGIHRAKAVIAAAYVQLNLRPHYA